MTTHKNDVYNIYKEIFATHIDIKTKNQLLATLLGSLESGWLVVGISVNAMIHLKSQGFKRSKDVVRAHIVPRIEISKGVFDNKLKSPHEFYDFIEKNDRTVLVLRNENKKNIDNLKIISFIDSNNNIIKRPDCKYYFRCAYVGYVHEQAEVDFLRNLQKNTPNTILAKYLILEYYFTKIIKTLDSDQASETIKQEHYSFPWGEMLDDWNILPFGKQGVCKENVIVFIYDENTARDTILIALNQISNTCRDINKLVLFHVDIPDKTWDEVWKPIARDFMGIAKTTGTRVIISFNGNRLIEVYPEPQVSDSLFPIL